MPREIDKRHGGAYDRGSADAYYRRAFAPHYFVGATYSTQRIDRADMTADELNDYTDGFADQNASGNFK